MSRRHPSPAAPGSLACTSLTLHEVRTDHWLRGETAPQSKTTPSTATMPQTTQSTLRAYGVHPAACSPPSNRPGLFPAIAPARPGPPRPRIARSAALSPAGSPLSSTAGFDHGFSKKGMPVRADISPNWHLVFASTAVLHGPCGFERPKRFCTASAFFTAARFCTANAVFQGSAVFNGRAVLNGRCGFARPEVCCGAGQTSSFDSSISVTRAAMADRSERVSVMCPKSR